MLSTAARSWLTKNRMYVKVIFYLLLLASINGALFWFNPLAWLLPKLSHDMEEFGQLQSISFRGVGTSGWDVYEAKFANSLSIWRIFMTPDGKISGLLIQAGP